MNLLGGRHRKLLLGAVALGLLLSVLVGLLLTPEQDSGDLVGVSFHSFQTNADHVLAWISVTNASKKGVSWMILESETKVNGQWTMCAQSIKHYRAFSPLGSGEMAVRVPIDGQVWRWRVEWLTELTRLQIWRLKLKEKAVALRPGSSPNWYAWLGAYRHTNYSKEFPPLLPWPGKTEFPR
jgi:hypothetical protein